MSISLHVLGGALVAELGNVFAALVGAEAKVEPGAAADSRQWIVECALNGEPGATCALTFDAAPITTLASAVVGVESDMPDKMVADTLLEVMNQAGAAVSLKPEAKGVQVAVTRATLHESAPAIPLVAAYAITVSTLAAPIRVGVYVTTASAASAGPPSVDPGPRIDVILDIDLPVVVRFGRTEMSIRALTRLGPGSVIDLGRSPDDPVEILVSDRVVAHGEVVVVGGNYGIRILDVASPAERMRTVEAWT
jgi:flagellar motor switch protein FliN/FliY